MNPDCDNCGQPAEQAEDKQYYCANPDCSNCKPCFVQAWQPRVDSVGALPVEVIHLEGDMANFLGGMTLAPHLWDYLCMENTDKITVKIGRRTGYAVYSSLESVHSTNDSNKTYRVYTQDGTYVMHVAGWQIDKMRVQ